MATITWISTTGGDWSDGANWQGGVVPGALDDAVMNQTSAETITIDSAETVHAVSFHDPAATFHVTAAGALSAATDVLLDGAAFTIDGTISSGSRVEIETSSPLTIVGAAPVTLGGNPTATGTLVAEAIAPGPGLTVTSVIPTQSRAGTAPYASIAPFAGDPTVNQFFGRPVMPLSVGGFVLSGGISSNQVQPAGSIEPISIGTITPTALYFRDAGSMSLIPSAVAFAASAPITIAAAGAGISADASAGTGSGLAFASLGLGPIPSNGPEPSASGSGGLNAGLVSVAVAMTPPDSAVFDIWPSTLR